jgi:hypothetical protein
MGLSTVEAGRDEICGIQVVEPRGIELSEPPPNNWMELTVKSVLSLARGRATARTLLLAAHHRR